MREVISSMLIDLLHLTRYNRIPRCFVELLVGERIGRYYRKLPDAIRLLEAHQVAASEAWALPTTIR